MQRVIEQIKQNLNLTATERDYGFAKVVYDQAEKADRIVTINPMERLKLDNSLIWQSAHLVNGGEPAKRTPFGTYNAYSFNLNLTMIVCSLSANVLSRTLTAFERTPRAKITRLETDTLTVLNRYWKHPANNAKNYDPRWNAIAIQYTIEGVRTSEIAHIL